MWESWTVELGQFVDAGEDVVVFIRGVRPQRNCRRSRTGRRSEQPAFVAPPGRASGRVGTGSVPVLSPPPLHPRVAFSDGTPA